MALSSHSRLAAPPGATNNDWRAGGRGCRECTGAGRGSVSVRGCGPELAARGAAPGEPGGLRAAKSRRVRVVDGIQSPCEPRCKRATRGGGSAPSRGELRRERCDVGGRPRWRAAGRATCPENSRGGGLREGAGALDGAADHSQPLRDSRLAACDPEGKMRRNCTESHTPLCISTVPLFYYTGTAPFDKSGSVPGFVRILLISAKLYVKCTVRIFPGCLLIF